MAKVLCLKGIRQNLDRKTIDKTTTRTCYMTFKNIPENYGTLPC